MKEKKEMVGIAKLLFSTAADRHVQLKTKFHGPKFLKLVPY